MGKTEKKINKLLIGAIIGTAIVGGFSMTPKGRSFWKRMRRQGRKRWHFFARGAEELKKQLQKNNPPSGGKKI